nr:MAG TPA: hypothetical protein [Caudoviricetes sp.]
MYFSFFSSSEFFLRTLTLLLFLLLFVFYS